MCICVCVYVYLCAINKVSASTLIAPASACIFLSYIPRTFFGYPQLHSFIPVGQPNIFSPFWIKNNWPLLNPDTLNPFVFEKRKICSVGILIARIMDGFRTSGRVARKPQSSSNSDLKTAAPTSFENLFKDTSRDKVNGNGPAVRVFTNGPGDLDSIPGRVIPKTLKMELDTTLLNTQHYKVRFKGKVEQSREWSSALPYTLV